jgi:hypothetical protein
MDKHPRSKKPARRADRVRAGSTNTPISHAQRRRDRQQAGVAESVAIDAEKLLPALRAGVLSPDKLVAQARHVLKEAKLLTERHSEGQISEEHAKHIIRSIKLFAKALDSVGVKVLGLRRIKQSHYISVMALWEKKPPGEARTVNWFLSHLRRLFVAIGRRDVIPRGTENKQLLTRHGLAWGNDSAFLISTYFDWASAGIDVEIILQRLLDPGRRVAAKMMYWWGMSLLEVASWQPVDPGQCRFLQVEAVNGRRLSREVEFSRDPEFAAKQMSALREAWNYCAKHDRPNICPPHLSAKQYAELLRMSISHALKQIPDPKLSPMQLRDGFFCQVYRDYAGMSLEQARRKRRLAQKDRRRLAVAWNEAKLQLGVQGAKAPHAHKGMPSSWSQSISIARSLRSISAEFAKFRVGDAWVGDVDASSGKCLFVQLLKGAQARVLPRLQELIEESSVVKQRVVRVLSAGDVPEGAAPVMLRSVPV